MSGNIEEQSDAITAKYHCATVDGVGIVYRGAGSQTAPAIVPHLHTFFGSIEVESLHVVPAGGELPPRYDSVLQSSFRIHHSSLNRAIWNAACPVQGEGSQGLTNLHVASVPE